MIKTKIFKHKFRKDGFEFEVNHPGLITIRNRVTEDYFVIDEDEMKEIQKAINYASSEADE